MLSPVARWLEIEPLLERRFEALSQGKWKKMALSSLLHHCYATLAPPLHYHYTRLHHRYIITVTSPLHHRYITGDQKMVLIAAVTPPLHHCHITGEQKMVLIAAVTPQLHHCHITGEQKMVLIAAALATRPAILVLDEPCQGLDETGRRRVLQLVERVSQVRKSGT